MAGAHHRGLLLLLHVLLPLLAARAQLPPVRGALRIAPPAGVTLVLAGVNHTHTATELAWAAAAAAPVEASVRAVFMACCAGSPPPPPPPPPVELTPAPSLNARRASVGLGARGDLVLLAPTGQVRCVRTCLLEARN